PLPGPKNCTLLARTLAAIEAQAVVPRQHSSATCNFSRSNPQAPGPSGGLFAEAEPARQLNKVSPHATTARTADERVIGGLVRAPQTAPSALHSHRRRQAAGRARLGAGDQA